MNWWVNIGHIQHVSRHSKGFTLNLVFIHTTMAMMSYLCGHSCPETDWWRRGSQSVPSDHHQTSTHIQMRRCGWSVCPKETWSRIWTNNPSIFGQPTPPSEPALPLLNINIWFGYDSFPTLISCMMKMKKRERQEAQEEVLYIDWPATKQMGEEQTLRAQILARNVLYLDSYPFLPFHEEKKQKCSYLSASRRMVCLCRWPRQKLLRWILHGKTKIIFYQGFYIMLPSLGHTGIGVLLWHVATVLFDSSIRNRRFIIKKKEKNLKHRKGGSWLNSNDILQWC